jgi:hypothetical protein
MRDDFLAPYNIVLARFLPVLVIFKSRLTIQPFKYKSIK